MSNYNIIRRLEHMQKACDGFAEMGTAIGAIRERYLVLAQDGFLPPAQHASQTLQLQQDMLTVLNQFTLLADQFGEGGPLQGSSAVVDKVTTNIQ